MLYSKLGSIPKPQTDGTDGWIEVPDAPICPDGKEVVWWSNEWVIRDPRPTDRAGFQWNWQHESRTWVESAWQVAESLPMIPPELLLPETTMQFDNLTTSQMTTSEIWQIS